MMNAVEANYQFIAPQNNLKKRVLSVNCYRTVDTVMIQ